MFSKVDLPQPEGPIIATNSPCLISILTLFNAQVSTSSVRKTFCKFSVLIMAIFNLCFNKIVVYYSYLTTSAGFSLAALMTCRQMVIKTRAAIPTRIIANHQREIPIR